MDQWPSRFWKRNLYLCVSLILFGIFTDLYPRYYEIMCLSWDAVSFSQIIAFLSGFFSIWYCKWKVDLSLIYRSDLLSSHLLTGWDRYSWKISGQLGYRIDNILDRKINLTRNLQFSDVFLRAVRILDFIFGHYTFTLDVLHLVFSR